MIHPPRNFIQDIFPGMDWRFLLTIRRICDTMVRFWMICLKGYFIGNVEVFMTIVCAWLIPAKFLTVLLLAAGFLRKQVESVQRWKTIRKKRHNPEWFLLGVVFVQGNAVSRWLQVITKNSKHIEVNLVWFNCTMFRKCMEMER